MSVSPSFPSMIGPTPPPALVLTARGKDQAKITTSAAECKKLCQNCMALFSSLEALKALVSEEGFKCFYSDLASGKSLGCPICTLHVTQILSYGRVPGIYYRLKAKLRKSQGDLDEETIYPLTILGIEFIVLEFEVPPQGLSSMVGDPLAVRCPRNDLSTQYLTCAPHPYPMSGDLYMQAAIRRLNKCSTEHKNCSALEKGKLPTRVIDVMPLDNIDGLRLHESEPLQQDLYVALSYCWGREPQFTTTKATFQDNIQGISITVLSRSVQDAVVTTRKLGIRYLWVDAICIIQDSPEDKSREIGLMGSVYSMAAITICASNASSAQEGFLDAQLPVMDFKVPFLLPNGILGSIVILKPSDTIPFTSPMPLEKRAWTFQESMLSPRLLIFGRGEVIWVCRTRKGNLQFKSLFPISSRVPLPSTFHGEAEAFNRSNGTDLSGDGDLLVQKRIKLWKSMIGDYSKRYITMEEDKIPALVGIATYLELSWGDVYLAGHWSSCLLHHLPWFAVENQPSLPASSYTAPSWSWLSTPGRYITVLDLEVTDAEVIDCSVAPRDPTVKLGNLKDGRLVLRAAVLDDLSTIREYTSSVRWRFDFTDQRFMHHVGGGIDEEELERNTCSADGDLKIRYLKIGYFFGSSVLGLILLGTEDDKWQRIGVFNGAGNKPESIWDSADRKIVTII